MVARRRGPSRGGQEVPRAGHRAQRGRRPDPRHRSAIRSMARRCRASSSAAIEDGALPTRGPAMKGRGQGRRSRPRPTPADRRRSRSTRQASAGWGPARPRRDAGYGPNAARVRRTRDDRGCRVSMR
jgi:hypothetical protein